MYTVIGAVISGLVTLCVCLVNNHFQRAEAGRKQAETMSMVQYQLKELTRRVEKHNQVVERTYALEGRMTEAEHDIRDLKGK